MLDGLKALNAVDRFGTVSEAAVALRLTQSAVSKRLRALEDEIGGPLLEKDGRRVRLTADAHELLSKARPLLSEIENLKFSGRRSGPRALSIGIADSIAGSWGPAVMRRAMRAVPGLKLEVHVHRSTLILENIKLGRYDLGLVTSKENEGGLICVPVTTEDMVVVGLREKDDSVLTIEPASATWREIGREASAHPRLQGARFEFVESFAAAAQMAREGFGRALVPIGVAKSLGFRASEYAPLSPRLKRKIHLVTRKSLYDLDTVKALSKALPGLIS